MISRQSLGKRRNEDIAALRKQARAWNRRVNQDKATIQWKFTRRQARRTLHYTITRSPLRDTMTLEAQALMSQQFRREPMVEKTLAVYRALLAAK